MPERKPLLFSQLIRFSTTGAMNTLIGLLAIYGLMYLNMGDIAANLGGYSIGLLFSFVVNGRWTFRQSLDGGMAARFIGVTCIAYAANLVMMLVARDALGIGSEFAQLVGVAIYSSISFVGYRNYAFKNV